MLEVVEEEAAYRDKTQLLLLGGKIWLLQEEEEGGVARVIV